MEFGQLIEYNVRNIFPEKSYTKYGGEALPRPFFKKSKIEHISSLKFIEFVFIVSPSKGYRNILKLSYRPLGFNLYTAFLKKEVWN